MQLERESQIYSPRSNSRPQLPSKKAYDLSCTATRPLWEDQILLYWGHQRGKYRLGKPRPRVLQSWDWGLLLWETFRFSSFMSIIFQAFDTEIWGKRKMGWRTYIEGNDKFFFQTIWMLPVFIKCQHSRRCDYSPVWWDNNGCWDETMVVIAGPFEAEKTSFGNGGWGSHCEELFGQNGFWRKPKSKRT